MTAAMIPPGTSTPDTQDTQKNISPGSRSNTIRTRSQRERRKTVLPSQPLTVHLIPANVLTPICRTKPTSDDERTRPSATLAAIHIIRGDSIIATVLAGSQWYRERERNEHDRNKQANAQVMPMGELLWQDDKAQKQKDAEREREDRNPVGNLTEQIVEVRWINPLFDRTGKTTVGRSATNVRGR